VELFDGSLFWGLGFIAIDDVDVVGELVFVMGGVLLGF
jgi:hypothetical protein